MKRSPWGFVTYFIPFLLYRGMQAELSFEDFEGDPRDRQKAVLRKFLELIHHERTPSGQLDFELVESDEESGLVRRKYEASQEPWAPQPVYEFTNPELDNGITLVALHGHGDDPFTGIYDYIPGLAGRGYRVVMPILFGTMERETKGLRPDWRDMCREWSIEADALGVTLIAARLHDAHLAYLLAMELEGVDRERIATIGLSMGGELSLYLTAIEKGIRACVSAGFMSSFGSLLLDKRNCQCYSIRDWPRYFDMPDIAGCIAPRPVLVLKGTDDPCLDPEDAEQAFERLKDIYRRFDAADSCSYRTYPGTHCLNQDLADTWLREQFR